MYSDKGPWTGHLSNTTYDKRTIFYYNDFELAADNIITFMQCTEIEIREKRIKKQKELEPTNA